MCWKACFFSQPSWNMFDKKIQFRFIWTWMEHDGTQHNPNIWGLMVWIWSYGYVLNNLFKYIWTIWILSWKTMVHLDYSPRIGSAHPCCVWNLLSLFILCCLGSIFWMMFRDVSWKLEPFHYWVLFRRWFGLFSQ